MKYIALDIGNVLCKVDTKVFLPIISETFEVSLQEAGSFLKDFQQIHDLGLTTMENQLKHRFNAKSETTIAKIVKIWNDSVVPHISIIDLVDKLSIHYETKIALLSNIGVEHAALMSEKLRPIYDKSIKHFSCFVGARKPSMLYYQSFLLQYPEFKGCLYVDDLQENLDISKQFGFQTYRLALDEPNSHDKILEIKRLMTHDPAKI